MIAVVMGGKIICGPMEWSVSAIQRAAFQAGYTIRSGVFSNPDGTACASIPESEPLEAVGLEGCRILPVVETDALPPEGKVLGGREPVILVDCVELRPIWADIPPPPDPAIAIAAARAAINAKRDALEFGIFTDTHGHRYDADERSRARLTGAVAMSAAIPSGGIVWTDADNLSRTHTQASLLSLAGEILLWTDALHQHASYLKGKLERGEEYDIETGWPA